MDTIKNHFQKIVEQARQDGAKVELLLSGGENLKLGYQKSKLETFESTQSQVAGFRVILKSAQGYAYTENLSYESLLRTYKDALANAQTLGEKSKDEVPLMKPSQIQPMSHLFREENIPMEKKMEAAKTLEEACFKADPRVQAVPYCSFNESVSFYRILNSEGLDHEFRQSYYSGYSYPIVKDDTGSKTDYESFFARSFNDIKAHEVAETSVKSAASRLGAQKLHTGNYPVVIDRDVFTTFITMITDYFSAKEVDEKRSLFVGKLGQKIADEKFNLIDDPFNERGTGVRPFDSEGAPSQKTVLIEKGVLKNFLTNLEYAHKMKLPHTAHAYRGPSSSMAIAPTNLVMEKGTSSLHDLLNRPGKVIHITNLNGALHSGFKEGTGDFSLPAEGFLYENGKLVGPIDQFVMSGNIFDVLEKIEALGNEYNKIGSSIMTPDVLVRELSFAGA
ncbi:TldD/PmbA family protein [Bdellovibrio sp. HCB2-146]|uniref:TldD/PmbA family protein n=1 Tax=Bdellovibrio sp. HCB2-146 TaxID=3394362 RepID=UPI0039BC862E